MANINNPFGFRLIKGPKDTETLNTTSNLTVYEGAPLVRKADGTLGVAGATSTGLFGFACHGVTGETGVRKPLMFFPATFDRVFEAQAATGTTVNLTEAVGKAVGVSATATYAVVKMDATTSVLQTVGWNSNSDLDASCAVLRVVVAKSTYVGVP